MRLLLWIIISLLFSLSIATNYGKMYNEPDRKLMRAIWSHDARRVNDFVASGTLQVVCHQH
jgi:hypothetical protein